MAGKDELIVFAVRLIFRVAHWNCAQINPAPEGVFTLVGDGVRSSDDLNRFSRGYRVNAGYLRAVVVISLYEHGAVGVVPVDVSNGICITDDEVVGIGVYAV